MNKILASSVILGVAVMMVGGILPAMAQPDIELDGKPKYGDNTACQKILPVLKKLISEGKMSKDRAQEIFDKVCKR